MRHIVLLLTLSTALTAGAESRFEYSYHRGTRGDVSMMYGDLHPFLRYQKALGRGRYVWARLEGREYLIRDAMVLDGLDDLLKPYDELHRQMDTLADEMEAVERRFERLEQELDDLSDRHSDYKDLSSSEKARMRDLHVELRAARNKLRPFEERERALEKQEEAIEKVVDDAIEAMVKKAVRNGIAERFR
jgi:chromosome segregation ATPase